MTSTIIRSGRQPHTVIIEMELLGTEYWSLAERADALGITIIELLIQGKSFAIATPILPARVGRPSGDRSSMKARIRELIDQGHRNVDIARLVGLSDTGVAHHRNRYMRELAVQQEPPGANGVTAAVAELIAVVA